MFRRLAIVAVAFALISAPALARNDKARGGPPQGGEAGGAQGTTGAILDAAFSALEASLIRDYYTRNPVPPQRLPPGIATNVARGKPLPPGIAKKALPGGLHGSLPPRQGYERVVVGTDVLLIAAATGLVVDVLRDVLR